eukprot:CAMPEP_0168445382 /NCGR_PEP_ID=MMETSP0228-20121227/45539_1 /TAXON_ID=133427 /ORGANISM="Protoceratium reticulatum, Strain CCCM 535 (=CCMP 1889)" /LENGTH=35 /DNA_ID= /DNA_START= /DNA_END= /DNA_ORIENTATION=
MRSTVKAASIKPAQVTSVKAVDGECDGQPEEAVGA